ncbi:hypothetical protein [Neorhizobium sp. P12A]|uniref:hypothetical protein n=1 Tax=Neorhizobium sp. P12A TaxID=2268027 RepID=UPI00165DC5FD|nr:hypothetical protein [Neorhizobium sp. P12A]
MSPESDVVIEASHRFQHKATQYLLALVAGYRPPRRETVIVDLTAHRRQKEAA